MEMGQLEAWEEVREELKRRKEKQKQKALKKIINNNLVTMGLIIEDDDKADIRSKRKRTNK